MFSQILPLALVLALVPATFAQVPISDKVLHCVKKINTYGKDGNGELSDRTEDIIVRGQVFGKRIEFGNVYGEVYRPLHEGSPYVFSIASRSTDLTGEKLTFGPRIAINLTDETQATKPNITSLMGDGIVSLTIHESEAVRRITIEDCKLATNLDMAGATALRTAMHRQQFSQFWTEVSDGGTVNIRLLKLVLERLDKYIPMEDKNLLKDMEGKSSEDDVFAIFTNLSDDVRKSLITKSK